MSIIQKLTLLCPHEEIFDVGFGNQALEQIPLIQPDLIFLDIRMPEMDGLELLHRLKTTYPFMHVVIISGYDDFEYARRALQYGAMDYMLKPADRLQLKENVDRVKREHEQVFQQQFELLVGKQTQHLLRFEDLTLYNLSLWFNERQWKSVIFEADAPEAFEAVKEAPQQIVFGFKTAANIEGFVIGSSMQEHEEGFCDKESCLPFLASRIATLEQRLFFGSASYAQGTTRYSETMASQAQQLRKQIFAQAVSGDEAMLKETIAAWFDCLTSFSLKGLRRECAQLMAMIDGGLTRQEQGVLVLDEDMLYYWTTWVEHCQTWEELKEKIHKLVVGGVGALNRVSRQAEEAANQSWFEHAIKLLDRTNDANVSLESVAEAVNVHPVTLSRMFKQQMGVTFVRYLTTRRLELARKLLLTTSKRINDIAEEIGYGDYRYFRTLFKKEYGYSPSEYRSKHGVDTESEEHVEGT